MADAPFSYFGSHEPVLVGDRILVRRLLGRAKAATVIYVPGQCEPNAGLGADQWAYRYDNGDIYAAGYSPMQVPHPRKGIEFMSRPGSVPAFHIPLEEPTGQPGRDFLALLGCGTLVVIFATLLVVAWQAVF